MIVSLSCRISKARMTCPMGPMYLRGDPAVELASSLSLRSFPESEPRARTSVKSVRFALPDVHTGQFKRH